jgi:hypothetical protein
MSYESEIKYIHWLAMYNPVLSNCLALRKNDMDAGIRLAVVELVKQNERLLKLEIDKAINSPVNPFLVKPLSKDEQVLADFEKLKWQQFEDGTK